MPLKGMMVVKIMHDGDSDDGDYVDDDGKW